MIAEGLNTKEYEKNRNELIDDIATVDSLKKQLEEGFKEIKKESEVWEIFSDKFKIGESMKYKNLQEFMDDINYKIMISILNGKLELKD